WRDDDRTGSRSGTNEINCAVDAENLMQDIPPASKALATARRTSRPAPARHESRMSYRLPSLNGLRCFEAAARHLSFKRAADELGVTPGAVSQQVKALEGALGITLFRRLPRGLILTDRGEGYLPAITA